MEKFLDQRRPVGSSGHLLEHPPLQENGEESHPSAPKKISLERASQESPSKPKSPTPQPGEKKSPQKWWDVIIKPAVNHVEEGRWYNRIIEKFEVEAAMKRTKRTTRT
jgi:hypothetical protein